ncbi:vacuolar membrane protein-domain-containing protein [Radiomyces spectabilis]|uniref:vacuolar membrane protein-domain-containing protein n=1 Tax=Radiomyces spectabilis TaxID=64574 RepID=UPI002220062A|nr:vacuolar membrane protein-domain-containing protein [Radiomyces spectabilis]KAI8377518.1 vacuolar membrane protein-domain-containing protein [Radiomyces spectabilis]
MLTVRDIPPLDDDEAGCKLLVPFSLFIQLCLAGAAFSTLIIKRQRESPQRPVRIWAFDVSKQLVGGLVIHTLNVLASYISGSEERPSNPCVWYFLHILVDTTFGVGVIWAILKMVKIITKRFHLSGFESGVYGDPPLWRQSRRWFKQLLVYIMALIMMKVVVMTLFVVCPWIENLGKWALHWTLGNYKLQVVFVMLIFPLVMNIVQFWIVDVIVKHKVDHFIRLPADDDDQDVLIPIEDEDDDVNHNDNNHHVSDTVGHSNTGSRLRRLSSGTAASIKSAASGFYRQNSTSTAPVPWIEDQYANVWNESDSHLPSHNDLSSPTLQKSLSDESLYELRTSNNHVP